MKAYVYPADNFGCGWYRLRWPSEALRAQGHDVVVIPPSNREGLGGSFDTRSGKLLDVQVPADADVVVLQRVSMRQLSTGIPLIRAKGIAVVVDMDDDLTKIDPNNPAFAALQVKGGNRWHNWRNAHQACLDATLVTVSTPALLKVYAPHGRGVVLENRVPAGYLQIPHVDQSAVGWPGSVHSHPNDLQVVGPSVARLVRDGIPYWGVGPTYRWELNDGGLRRALGLDVDPPTSGDVSLDDWPLQLARMGVGMAPLADTAFNRAKSWLKPLELSACGVPWVASATPEYGRLQAKLDAGLLARTPKDWYRMLKRLASDAALRADMASIARAAIADPANELTIESSAHRWAQAWTEAVKLQRATVSASA